MKRPAHDGSAPRRLTPLDGATTGREANSLEEFIENAWLIGSPETVIRGLKAYEAEGIPQMRLWFTFGPGATHDAFSRALDLFIKEVLPALNPEPIWDPASVSIGSEVAA